MYSRGTSFPLVMAIAGPLMILPNVGLNEWGHAFWFMEELFSAPLHWGFVILGWAGLFSGGIAAQIITRYSGRSGTARAKSSSTTGSYLNRLIW